MKKALLFLLFVVLMTTSITAQERDQDRIQDQDRTKLVMVNGEMLQVRDRAQIRLQDKLTLNDGTVISPDGSYITKDSDRLRLRDGECLDSDGVKYRNEYQYRYKINQESKGLSQAQIQERNQNRIHYMFVEGELLQIQNQTQERLQAAMILDNGTVVNPNGTFQARDRKELRLQDGECLNMNGEMFKNTLQHRKMLVQKNKNMNMKANKKGINKKVQKKPNVQKKSIKKGVNG